MFSVDLSLLIPVPSGVRAQNDPIQRGFVGPGSQRETQKPGLGSQGHRRFWAGGVFKTALPAEPPGNCRFISKTNVAIVKRLSFGVVCLTAIVTGKVC